MTAKITVVVPTYRRADRLHRLATALATQTLDPAQWELVVVDDCSCDPAVDSVLAELPDLVGCRTRALRTPANGGPAVARNVGWRASTAPIVAFVDDDVVPDPKWLEAGLRAFDDDRVGVVQGHARVPADVDLTALPAWSLWRVVDGDGPFFEACNIFYRRAALEQTRGFDEELAWWGEDTTVGWQVVEAGWQRAFCAEASAVHDVTVRGPGWFVRNGWLEHHVVALAARHPGYRAEAFWRPWAYRKRDAAFVLASLSALAALRWRPALLGVLPYLWWGRPSIRHRERFLRVCAETALVDTARTAGHLAGALRHRIVVI
jgi:glycosyltransferase involved in cell wall biosynthesis